MIQFLPIKTRVFVPPQDDLYQLLDKSIVSLSDGDILLVTSKILAIYQGRCVRMDSAIDKDELIIKESERYIPRAECPGGLAILTIKDHTLAVSAGIDESNANGHYILFPQNAAGLVQEIRAYLLKRFFLTKLGVIATDSHSVPLRYGVTGIAVAFAGFNPLRVYTGSKDIFGRVFSAATKTNLPDSLASIAVLLMGEGQEQTPLLIIRGADMIEFGEHFSGKDLFVPPEDDIYAPLLKSFQKGGDSTP